MGKHNLLGMGNNICKFLSYCNKKKMHYIVITAVRCNVLNNISSLYNNSN